jgi:hypothetical protein
LNESLYITAQARTYLTILVCGDWAMPAKRVLIPFMILGVFTSSAYSLECKLNGRGGNDVFIWKDSAAQSEAYKLVAAKVHETNPPLVMRLMSCIAEDGDNAIITNVGFASHSILVVSGKRAGCRGVVAREWCETKR